MTGVRGGGSASAVRPGSFGGRGACGRRGRGARDGGRIPIGDGEATRRHGLSLSLRLRVCRLSSAVGVGRPPAGACRTRPGDVPCGFPFLDHGFELAGQFFQLANGRAASRREHGVLGRVFGEGGDQHGDDRGDRLAQGSGRGGMHG